jgi:hypothetical protein
MSWNPLTNDSSPGDLTEGYFTRQPWNCSGAIRISDPCYPNDFRALGVAASLPAVPGQWNAYAVGTRGYGKIVTWSEAAHPNGQANCKPSEWAQTPLHVYSDSNLCGVFDDKRYPTDAAAGQELMAQASKATSDGIAFGSVGDIGVVAHTGNFGESYPVYRHTTKNGEVDAVCIEFASPHYQ